MANDPKILSELEGQAQGRNPFAIAQMKAQSMPQVGQAQFVGDPFSPQAQPPLTSQYEQNPNQQSSQMFSSLFQQPSMGQPMDAQLMQSIKKFDIDSQGITINPLGKQTLMSRLQKRWGDKYQENPGVKEMLGQFDKALSMYSDESSKSMAETLNKTQRTLAALRS